MTLQVVKLKSAGWSSHLIPGKGTHLQKHLEFNVQLLNTVEVTINYVAQWKQLPREVLSSLDSIVHNLMNEVKQCGYLNEPLIG